jgi:hypothetical protein
MSDETGIWSHVTRALRRRRQTQGNSDTPEVSHEQQGFGFPTGRFNIRCTFRADRSQWTHSIPSDSKKNPTSPTQGLLYFNFVYEETADVPLKYASVQIDVKPFAKTERPPRFTLGAPEPAIEGNTQERFVQESGTAEAQPELTAEPVGGAKAGKLSRQKNTEFKERNWWTFRAQLQDDTNRRLYLEANAP